MKNLCILLIALLGLAARGTNASVNVCAQWTTETCQFILNTDDPVYKCVNNKNGWNGCDLYKNNPVLAMSSSSRYGISMAVALGAAGAGLITVAIFTYQVMQFPTGGPLMTEIAEKIHEGARAFLNTEYKYLAVFVVVVFAAICGILALPSDRTQGVYTGICFLVGAFLSALAGYGGMWIATKANVRTTQACSESMNQGLSVAFKSGAVMGFTVVSFGLIGLSSLYLIFTATTSNESLVWQYLSGFGFGASSIALFARVGGGVYTKAADVGADLVGKVEAGIPEDDRFNPAVIADNVGDNVGDVAGMGADLFESYCGSIIAAATIGYDTFSQAKLGSASNSAAHACCVFGGNVPLDPVTNYANSAVALPFWIAGFGLLCSIMGTFLIRTDQDEKSDPNHALDSLLKTIRIGIYSASLVVVGFNALCCYLLFDGSGLEWKLFGCTIIGLVGGNVIGAWTEFCTSYSEFPTQGIARKSNTGPATVIIQGLGVGMISTAVPLFTLVIIILSTNALASRYGIALSAVSMLATLGITLATDAYGPVADNAGGIAEMVGDEVPEETRIKTDMLDALGNTTAATGKGFAIGSAALTSVALISAFIDQVGLPSVNVEDPTVLSGMLLGASLPFIFAALTMLSVGRAAEAIIEEVRDQFKKHPELKTASVTGWKPPPGVPDYTRCVNISTEAALIEMINPGVIAILSPLAIGYLLGSRGLVGLLVGSLVAGILLAVTMANAGGAWDNAKKWVEKEGLGPTKGKGTPFHEAVVVGDTVGDPFKDTSGPALNILIKMMSLISLVFAPSFKLTNPQGDAFGNNWWIGVILLAIMVIVVAIVAVYTSKRYAKISKDLEEASERLMAGEGAPVDAEVTTNGEPASAKEVEMTEVATEVAVEENQVAET